MGYLDELKKQAEQVKTDQQNAQEEAARKQAKFREQVLPIMRKVHFYLREMAQQLNYIKPATRVSYAIKGPGTIDSMLQAEYLVSHYNEYKNSFFLRCVAFTEQPVRFELDDPIAAKAQHDYLWSHNIRFDEVQINDANGRFQRMQFALREGVNIEFNFGADYENSAILLQVRNFDQLGKRSYRFLPEQVSEAFLDDLAQYITRDPDSGSLLKQCEIENAWALTQEKTKQTLKARQEQQQQQPTIEQKQPDTVSPVSEEARQQRLKKLHEQKLQEELAKARVAKESRETELKKKSLLEALFGRKK